ncbi:MAG: transporter substrate-binding domain-containing protein [Methanospirillum sp.]|nr:transporter substrate-binding domain-containing protein [Methanospirillum sp.]
MHPSLRFCLVLLLATAAVLAGCSAPTTDATPTTTAPTTASPPTQAGRLTLLTEEYPPLNYEEDGEVFGIAVDLLDETLTRFGTGQSIEEVRFLPWPEAYNRTLIETDTVLFATERLPEREALFKWGGPIYPERAVLYGLRERNITVASASDLQHYRIAAVRHDAALQKLLDLGVPASGVRTTDDQADLVAWLYDGEVDLIAYGEVPGRWLALRAAENPHRMTPVFTLAEYQTYFAFNRNTSEETVARFQTALDRLSVDRGIDNLTVRDRIIRQYIPPVALARTAFLTEEYPPLNTAANGTVEGIAPDLLRAAAGRVNLTLREDQVRLTTWTEAYRTALEQNETMVFSTARTPDREDLFQWAGPIARLQYVVLAERDREISPDDLARHRIATVLDDTSATFLRDAGVPDAAIVYETRPDALVDAVRDGRADAIAYPLITARTLLAKAGIDPNRFEVVRTLGEHDLYYAFNRNVSPIVVRAINMSIAELKDGKDEYGVAPYERILYRHVGVECSSGASNLTGAMAVVNLTAERVASDAAGTFREIDEGRPPFRDPADPEVYAFVYDTNLTMVAHPNPQIVGMDLADRVDVTGKPFRNEIRETAKTKGSGWVDYVYVNIDESRLSEKTTYCRLVTGSDRREYIVCAGTFRDCGT